MPAAIRDLDPTHTAMIARLLRTQIRLNLVCRRTLIDTEPRTLAAINVVLLWPVPIEANAVIVRRERKEHRKVRHLGQPRCSLIVECNAERPRHIHRIGDAAGCCGRRCECIGKAHVTLLARRSSCLPKNPSTTVDAAPSTLYSIRVQRR